MLGYMRLVVPEHFVIESHPENPFPDTRLIKPFPKLTEHCRKTNLGDPAMTLEQHSHVPWAVVLHNMLDKWREVHDGKAPRTSAEKREFKETVKAARRVVDGVAATEDNFDEAIKAIGSNMRCPTMAVEDVSLLVAEAAPINQSSSKFWIMVHALGDFIQAHGVLPVQGGIPDMTANSTDYVALQNVYVGKAYEDLTEISTNVAEKLSSIGR